MSDFTATTSTPLSTLAAVIFSGFAPYGRAPVSHGEAPERIIGAKDLQDGCINAAEVESILVDDPRKVVAYRVSAGDVLLTTRGAAPKAAVCDNAVAGFLAGANLAVIRLKPAGPIGPNLLQAMFESPGGQLALKALSQGSSTLGIRPKALAELSLCIPPAEEAAKMEQLCETLRQLRRSAKATIMQHERIVHALAGQFFSTQGEDE